MARDSLVHVPSVLITAPTGSGKTLIFSEIARLANQRGLYTAVLCDRQELIKQAAEAIYAQTQEAPGIVWQRYREWNKSANTIVAHGSIVGDRPIEWDHPIHILFTDEAHHSPANGWREAIHRINARYNIGFSATPFRSDRNPLHPDPFQQVIRPITPNELIKLGHLVPPHIVSLDVTDPSGNTTPINRAHNVIELYLQAIRYALADNRRKIILYVSRTATLTPKEVIRQTQQALQELGVPAFSITEGASAATRASAVAQFDALPTAVLINYMTLTEGFNSRQVDCVILGRSSASEATIIQMIGRGLREYAGKKDCLILDFTGRDDTNEIINYWRLDDTKTRKQKRKRRQFAPQPAELAKLTANFPQIISQMQHRSADYPWLKPFPSHPVLVLPHYKPDTDRAARQGRYIAAHSTGHQRWRVSRVIVPQNGPPIITRFSAQTDDSAAKIVLAELGGDSIAHRRDHPRRLGPPTPNQIKECRSINPAAFQKTDPLSYGDAADIISLSRFTAAVGPNEI